jgi:hypothetical protein
VALAAAASAIATVLAAGGCELAIGDAVPAFACDPGPDTCPQGTVCDPARHQCVAFCTVSNCPGNMQCDAATHLCIMVDSSVVPMGDAPVDNTADASSDQGDEGDVTVNLGDAGGDSTPSEGAPYEANTGESGVCSALICKCVGNAACDSRICADQLAVGTGLYTAAASTNFCTKPCCTSADCDGSTVCYATSGGRYCVLPAWLQRSQQLGTAVGGDSCSSNASCRSGLCTGGTCADTCCSTALGGSQCGSGTECSFGAFPGTATFDQGYTSYCSPGNGTLLNGAMCNISSDCVSNRCDFNVCRDACRSTADCGQGYACEYSRDRGSNGVFAACYPYTQAGPTPLGGSCQSSSECVTGFCDPTAMQCTDVCFADSDCSSVSGWRCRPEQITVQGGGMADVLCCGM